MTAAPAGSTEWRNTDDVGQGGGAGPRASLCASYQRLMVTGKLACWRGLIRRSAMNGIADLRRTRSNGGPEHPIA